MIPFFLGMDSKGPGYLLLTMAIVPYLERCGFVVNGATDSVQSMKYPEKIRRNSKV